MLAYVDGDVVPLDDARLPITDRGYLLGDGIFETLRAHDGEVMFRDAHRARFAKGLVALGLPADTTDFDAAIDALVAAGPADLRLRIQASTGPMQDIPGPTRAVVTGIATPFQAYPEERLRDGVDLVTSPYRLQRDSPLAGIKHLSFLPYIAARRDAIARGAHDALLFNDAGRPVEATTANLFLRDGETVHAPGAGEGVVAGVTRDVVIGILRGWGMTVDEQAPDLDVEEAFLTNTTGGVVPIRSIDGRRLEVGKLTRRLQEAM